MGWEPVLSTYLDGNDDDDDDDDDDDVDEDDGKDTWITSMLLLVN